MKKGLKILLFVFIGCVICIVLYGAIKLFNEFGTTKYSPYYPEYIYENADEYIDLNASDTDQVQLSFAAEANGELFYINADDNLLYKKSVHGEDIQISSSQMDQMMVVGDYIVFSYDQSLMMQNMITDEVITISELYKYAVSDTTYVNNTLLFISNSRELYSYDLIKQHSIVLSENTDRFKVNGKYIFYKVYIDDSFDGSRNDGIYGMDIDGGNQNRITDVGEIREYEVYKHMLFISTGSSSVIFKIDMENSSYIKFPVPVFLNELYLINENVYYSAGDDFDEDGYGENMFIATDLDGNIVSKIKEIGNHDRCWAEYNDGYVYLIIVADESDSTVRILDKSGNSKNDVIYKNCSIEEFVCLPDYIVVRTKENDRAITYVYDLEYELLSKF